MFEINLIVVCCLFVYDSIFMFFVCVSSLTSSTTTRAYSLKCIHMVFVFIWLRQSETGDEMFGFYTSSFDVCVFVCLRFENVWARQSICLVGYFLLSSLVLSFTFMLLLLRHIHILSRQFSISCFLLLGNLLFFFSFRSSHFFFYAVEWTTIRWRRERNEKISILRHSALIVISLYNCLLLTLLCARACSFKTHLDYCVRVK